MAGRDLDAHIAQLLDVPGHAPVSVIAGFPSSSGDGDGHQAARQAGAAEQVDNGPADTRGNRDPAQGRVPGIGGDPVALQPVYSALQHHNGGWGHESEIFIGL